MTLAIYTHFYCDNCEGLTAAPYVVIGNPEHFCGLACAKQFYCKTLFAIWKHRKDKRHETLHQMSGKVGTRR